MDLYEPLSNPDTLTLQEMLDSDIKAEFGAAYEQAELGEIDTDRYELVETLDARLDMDLDTDILQRTWLNGSSPHGYNNMDIEATGILVNPSTAVPVGITSDKTTKLNILCDSPIANSKMAVVSASTTSSTSHVSTLTKIPALVPISAGIQVQYSNNFSNLSNMNKIQTNQNGQKVFPKPAFSYSCLIAMALKNSRTGSLPVSEIYNFMCEHFPYFKTAPSGWKNSVRHNLSLNKCFEKIEKQTNGGGQKKGCLWTMNPDKISKMDEEVQKWSRKDPLAIKQAMVNPGIHICMPQFYLLNFKLENLEFLERGEMKIDCKERHLSGNGSADSDEEEDISTNARLEVMKAESVDNSSTTLELVDLQGSSAVYEAVQVQTCIGEMFPTTVLIRCSCAETAE